MKNLKIRSRLLVGFGVLLVLLVIVSLFSINRMHYLAEFTDKLYRHPLTVSNAARDADIGIIKIHRAIKDIAMAETEENLEILVIEVGRLEKVVLEKLQVVEEFFLGDKAKVRELIENFNSWGAVRTEVIRLSRQGLKEKAMALVMGKEAGYVADLENQMKAFTDFAGEKAAEFLRGAHAGARTSYLVVGIADVLAILVSLVIAYLITRSIIRPVQFAVDVAEQLARGDLSVVIPEHGRDEMGLMLDSMDKMAGNLKEQIGALREGITTLSSSAAEIFTATAQLASVTQEVSTSVNQVVVSMKEVKQTTVLSNEKAGEMAQRSRTVVQTSREGESAVQHTIELINAIQDQMASIAQSVVGLSEQSQSIGEIITAVDDVADQSRLLAVNASIEAVKAGEHGKGFSVVAEEIKNLARQSKQSTSQVRDILSEIRKATGATVMVTEKGSKAVESGVKQAEQTGDAIRTLGESIEQTSRTAVQIEATSRQQSAGIEEVFTAMESIGNAIEQNAASARQLEESAQGLDGLGRKMKNIVEKYKLPFARGGDGGGEK